MAKPRVHISDREIEAAHDEAEINRLHTLLRGIRAFVADSSTTHVHGPNFVGSRREAVQAIDAEVEGEDREKQTKGTQRSEASAGGD